MSTEADLERERSVLRSEYEEKIEQLQKDVEREQETNAKAAAEMDNLRRAYQDELEKINSESMRKVYLIALRTGFIYNFLIAEDRFGPSSKRNSAQVKKN